MPAELRSLRLYGHCDPQTRPSVFQPLYTHTFHCSFAPSHTCTWEPEEPPAEAGCEAPGWLSGDREEALSTRSPERRTSLQPTAYPLAPGPSPWSVYLLGKTEGAEVVRFVGTHFSIDKGSGRVLDSGAGYTKAPMVTQADTVMPVRRPPRAPLTVEKGEKWMRPGRLGKEQGDEASSAWRWQESTSSPGHMTGAHHPHINATVHFLCRRSCSLYELESSIMMKSFIDTGVLQHLDCWELFSF